MYLTGADPGILKGKGGAAKFSSKGGGPTTYSGAGGSNHLLGSRGVQPLTREQFVYKIFSKRGGPDPLDIPISATTCNFFYCLKAPTMNTSCSVWQLQFSEEMLFPSWAQWETLDKTFLDSILCLCLWCCCCLLLFFVSLTPLFC